MEILESKQVNDFFLQNNYIFVDPHEIKNNDDTVFISAGIQPLLKKYRNNLLPSNKEIFIPQPVIRTQYINSLNEGSSLAFVNITSSAINITEEKYIKMVSDWYEFLNCVGLKKSNISTHADYYKDTWGDINLEGKRTFYYYNNVEIGDTTFFTKISDDSKKILFDTMCDLGFGLERIRWLYTLKSYYDLYSDSSFLSSKIKALISALALLNVNNIQPSNKNAGYRVRQFSKKIVEYLQGRDFDERELTYIRECISYWQDWQHMSTGNIQSILNENIRNGNRYIINALIDLGYKNLANININIPREELFSRLSSAGVESEIIRKIERK